MNPVGLIVYVMLAVMVVLVVVIQDGEIRLLRESNDRMRKLLGWRRDCPKAATGADSGGERRAES